MENLELIKEEYQTALEKEAEFALFIKTSHSPAVRLQSCSHSLDVVLNQFQEALNAKVALENQIAHLKNERAELQAELA